MKRNAGVLRLLGFLSAAVLSMLFAAPLLAQSPTPPTSRLNVSDLEISVDSLFAALPQSGFAPFVVRIKNRSGRDRSWRFEARLSHPRSPGTYSERLSVPDGEERRFEVYVPLGDVLDSVSSSVVESATWSTLAVEVKGYGADHLGMTLSSGYEPERTMFVGMSSALALRSWPVLASALQQDRKTSLDGTVFNPGEMPADWRGYSGLGILAVTDSEWDTFAPEVRSAIADWVYAGGQLHLFGGQKILARSSFDPLRISGQKNRIGLGSVRLFEWDGREIAVSYLDGLHFWRAPQFQSERNSSALGSSARVAVVKHSPKFVAGLSIMLCAYALLVGPMNMFFFANRSGRLQLFITTPLISLVTSALLCTVLVFREGTGGRGERRSFVFLLPERKKAFVIQEQISRTSLLMGSEFTLKDSAYAAPVVINYAPTGSTREFRRDDGVLGGDWFSNSSVQAHLFANIVPTRAGLSFYRDPATGRPFVRSSINAPLTALFVHDTDGNFWEADRVPIGGRVPLRRATEQQYGSWKRLAVVAHAGVVSRRALSRLGKARGSFLAIADGSTEFMMGSLPSIRWREDKTFIGGMLESASPTPGGSAAGEADE